MAGAGFVAQPLTAVLKTTNEMMFDELTMALMKQFGRMSISCCQPVGLGLFHITFANSASYQRAMTEGVKVRNEIVSLEAVCGVPITITVRNAPYAMKADTITTHLRQYGPVLYHAYEFPTEENPVTNGNRRVRMIMNAPIPNFLRIGPYQLMIVYPGVKRVCRRCSQEGHFARECGAVYCRGCRAWLQTPDCVHMRQMERDEDKIAEAEVVTTPLVIDTNTTDEQMEVNMEENRLWNDVFQPSENAPQQETSVVAKEIQTPENAPAIQTRSFSEVVDTSPAVPARKPSHKETDSTKQQEKSTKSVSVHQRSNSLGRSSGVLPPPPTQSAKEVVPVFTPLGLKRSVEADSADKCAEVLQRTLSVSSTSSATMHSAYSGGSENEQTKSEKSPTTKRKKKKSESGDRKN